MINKLLADVIEKELPNKQYDSFKKDFESLNKEYNDLFPKEDILAHAMLMIRLTRLLKYMEITDKVLTKACASYEDLPVEEKDLLAELIKPIEEDLSEEDKLQKSQSCKNVCNEIIKECNVVNISKENIEQLRSEYEIIVDKLVKLFSSKSTFISKNKHSVIIIAYVSLCEYIENAEKENKGISIYKALLHLFNYIETDLFLKKNAEDPLFKEQIDKLKCYSPVKPNHYVIPNAKAVNYLVKYDYENLANPFGLNVSNSKDIVTSIAINWGGEEITTSKNIEIFDRNIFNAFCSLYNHINTYNLTPTITIKDIYKALPGNANKRNVPPVQYNEIKNSMDKLFNTVVTIDATEELIDRKILKPGESWKRTAHMIDVVKDTVALQNGKIEENAYTIRSAPVLYEYCKALGQRKKNKGGQIVSVPYACLNLPSLPRTSPEIVAIANYFVVHIDTAKKGNLSRCIRYETLLSKCDITINNKQRLSEYKKTIKLILTDFSNSGLIKGFKEYKEGRKIIGIELEF